MRWKILTLSILIQSVVQASKCFAPGQGVDISKRIRGSTTVLNGAVTFVGTPDENGQFNATVLVRKLWSKKNMDLKENVVIRLGPFGTDKKCPTVKARMSYIFFIRNSGERKGKYRFFKVQLFPAYASEANLKIADTILGIKPTGGTTLPMKMESKNILHSSQVAPKAQYNKAGCISLDAPVNGDMKCLPNGRQCDFSCNDGYEMIGFYRKVCLGKQKGWKPIKPVLCKSSAEVENEIKQAGTTPTPLKARPGLSNTNLNKLFGPNYKQQPMKDIPKVNYNQKVLHSAFSPPPGASDTEKLKVNLKSIGNAGLVANQKALEAMKRQQNLIVQQSFPIIDPYFQQFTPETCVEHPGSYHQMYKTSTGFTANAKIAPQQKISGKWILVITFQAPIGKLELQNKQLYLIAHQSNDRRMFAIKNTISHPGFIMPTMPLDVLFDAEFNGMLMNNEARVVLYEDCDHFKPSIKQSFLRSPSRGNSAFNSWGRQSLNRATMAPTTTLAPRITHNQEIYRAQLDMDVDRCSPYQPAGILPGSGQVQPRWISSVFKSAMRYDYNELLHKSLLFVQAQRSGHINKPNSYELNVDMIPWRGDSGLKDGCMEGADLEGGLYHDDGFVKHGLPTASAVTVMLWGLVDYKKAYESTGEFTFGKRQLRWILDYYQKAHVSKYELYVQVGDVETDKQYWGRAEEMDMDRPAAKITPEYPGSDVASEIAAAMAAGSMVYFDEDPLYASKLLQHARDLFDFALTYQGSYSDHIETGEKYQKRTGYLDELVWAALWLYRATNDTYYLGQAESIYREGAFYSPKTFDWDDKRAGNLVLLARITGREIYKLDLNKFLTWAMESAYRTPKGLLWLGDDAPNRHAANVALIALQAGLVFPDHSTMYETFAKKQINYLLGDSGRSFVVGFGINPPQRPYHRGSSCPDVGQSCSWQDAELPRGNPQVLFGALVGGPDRFDRYEDTRNPDSNDVALDYTAGLMTAVAGLKESTQKTKNVRYFGRWSG